GLVESALVDELLHPARVEIDGEPETAVPQCLLSDQFAEDVRPARAHREPVGSTRIAVGIHGPALVMHQAVHPVGERDDPLRWTGRPTALENADHLDGRAVALRNEILDT